MLSKISNVFKLKKKTKIIIAAVLVIAIIASMSVFAFAAGSDPLKTVIEEVMKVMKRVFVAIGILLLLWGVGMLILAFKNEDADSKSRAMMLIAVSAALVGIGTFLDDIYGAVAGNLT